MIIEEIVERVDVEIVQTHPEMWGLIAEALMMHYRPEAEIVDVDGFVGKDVLGLQDAGFLVITVRSEHGTVQ